MNVSIALHDIMLLANSLHYS